MILHVEGQTTRVSKVCLTDRADVLFMVRLGWRQDVGSHMLGQSFLCLEGSLAYFAGQWLVVWMADLMFGQEMLVLKAFIAHFTDIGLDSGMIFHVNGQAPRERKVGVTHWADVLLLAGLGRRRSVDSHVFGQGFLALERGR